MMEATLFRVHYIVDKWDIWCKALGNKAFSNKRKADRVALVRSAWVLLHIVTCCFIIAGNVKVLFLN